MYVTDTSAFVWFLTSDKRLGKSALRIFRMADYGKELIVIPSIVLMEMLYLCEHKGLKMALREIINMISRAENYMVFPLNLSVIMACMDVPLREIHDRIIVATAKILNSPLITNDKNIIKSKIVETVW